MTSIQYLLNPVSPSPSISPSTSHTILNDSEKEKQKEIVVAVEENEKENQNSLYNILNPIALPTISTNTNNNDIPDISTFTSFSQLFKSNSQQNKHPIFPTFESALSTAKHLALKLGFQIRIKTTIHQKKDNSIYKYICCQRQGLPEHGWKLKDGKRKRKRSSVRCHCRWGCKLIGAVVGESSEGSGGKEGDGRVWYWEKSEKEENHNHPLDYTAYSPVLTTTQTTTNYNSTINTTTNLETTWKSIYTSQLLQQQQQKRNDSRYHGNTLFMTQTRLHLPLSVIPEQRDCIMDK